MKLDNVALVPDEMLLHVSQVLEGGWPAGPAFLHALSSLCEAAILHETIYYDPLNYLDRTDLLPDDLESLLKQSIFVRSLNDAGVLTRFDSFAEVDALLAEREAGYTMGHFLAESTYTGISFAWAEPEGEQIRYEALRDLLKIPAILRSKNLMERMGGGYSFTTFAVPIAIEQLGFNYSDIQDIESFNQRAAAYGDLARHLDLNLYMPFQALPHQIGAVQDHNSRVRTVYEKLEAALIEETEADDDVGSDAFRRFPIPPLGQIVLARSRGDARAIPVEIMALRLRHEPFRRYLTSFESEWKSATTRSARLRLKTDFDNAWKSMMEQIHEPHTRLIYRIWDILKKPTGILTAVGDLLAAEGRKLAIISRAAGMLDFWNEIADSPVAAQNRMLVAKTFQRRLPDETWDLASSVASAANSMIDADAN